MQELNNNKTVWIPSKEKFIENYINRRIKEKYKIKFEINKNNIRVHAFDRNNLEVYYIQCLKTTPIYKIVNEIKNSLEKSENFLNDIVYFRDIEDKINEGIFKFYKDYYVRFGFWNSEDTYYNKTIIITLFSRKYGAIYCSSIHYQDIAEETYSIEGIIQDQLNFIKDFEKN